jgi:hypothetical protein
MFPISKVHFRQSPGIYAALFFILYNQAPPTYVIDTPGIMMPSVTKWSTAAALAAVGCISVARVDALSVLAFCLRQMRTSSQLGQGAVAGSTCLCKFIVHKTKSSDAMGGLKASLAVKCQELIVHSQRNIVPRRARARPLTVLQLTATCLNSDPFQIVTILCVFHYTAATHANRTVRDLVSPMHPCMLRCYQMVAFASLLAILDNLRVAGIMISHYQHYHQQHSPNYHNR